jgi:DNA-binding SARP family transcriptional activator/DNA-binding beta-propeller fold protein YncE
VPPILEFRALGPLAVLADGEAIDLGRGNERMLLALLVLHAGRPLSSDAIIDAIWGERPPPTAREMVRNYVARARRRLGDEAIATLPAGYTLRIGEGSVDLISFTALARDGATWLEEGEPERALALLEQALALWRGRPLPELDLAASGREELGRLEEQRLTASEDRIDAALAVGRSAALVPELEERVREHPFRERPLAQLMLALYRCGRQKDALDRFQAARRRLVDETGLEPGRAVQELQRAILQQSPSLDPPRTLASEEAPRPKRRSRRVAVALLAAVVLAGGITTATAVLLSRGTPHVRLLAQSLGALDDVTGTPVGSLPVGGLVHAIAVEPNAVWVGSGLSRSALAIDPRTLHVIRRVGLSANPATMVAGGGSVWIGNGYDGTLTRIAGSAGASAPFRPEPRSTGRLPLAYGTGSLWVGAQDGRIARVDGRSGVTGKVLRVPLPEALATGTGALWVLAAASDDVIRVDPAGGRVLHTIPIGGRGLALAIADGAVWVVTAPGGRLWRIDARGNDVSASIAIAGEPIAVVAAGGLIWIASATGVLTAVDPRTDSVTRTIALGHPITALVGGDGRLWVALA